MSNGTKGQSTMTDKQPSLIARLRRSLHRRLFWWLLHHANRDDVDTVVQNHFKYILGRRMMNDPTHPLILLALQVRDWSDFDVVLLTSNHRTPQDVCEFRALNPVWRGQGEMRSTRMCQAGAGGMILRERPMRNDA